MKVIAVALSVLAGMFSLTCVGAGAVLAFYSLGHVSVAWMPASGLLAYGGGCLVLLWRAWARPSPFLRPLSWLAGLWLVEVFLVISINSWHLSTYEAWSIVLLVLLASFNIAAVHLALASGAARGAGAPVVNLTPLRVAGVALLFAMVLVPVRILLEGGAWMKQAPEVVKGSGPVLAKGMIDERDTAPRWISEEEERGIWEAFNRALSGELKPTTEEETGTPMQKRLYRVLLGPDVALAVVGWRFENMKVPTVFKVFSIDLKTGDRVPVGDGFHVWRFERFARIDAGPVPDVIFSHDSCGECEPTRLLGSWRFDPVAKRWDERVWESDEYVPMVANYGHGDEGDFVTTCMYSIGDFTADGFDDIATYCRTDWVKGGSEPPVAGIAGFAAAEKGASKDVPWVEARVLKGEEAERLRRTLCKSAPKPELCK